MCMSKTDEKLWAREEILSAIDAMIAQKGKSADGLTLDEEMVLTNERMRIAKLFRMD